MNGGAKGLWKQVKENAVFILTTCMVLSAALLFLNAYHQLVPDFGLLSSLNHSSTESQSSETHLDQFLHPQDHVYRKPRTIYQHWAITKGYRAPDGVKKLVYLINDEFPGPTIEARSGDTLVIKVVNNLQDDEGVSLHWHGLHMRGANEMDGVVGFTQCPIPTNASFTYKFDIDSDQSGTFWYHSHSREQIGDGLWGGLVIHKPAELENEQSHYGYDEEILLLIGDWFHHPAEELMRKYLHWSSAGAEPVPDSMLINGAGSFNCSMLIRTSSLQCTEVVRPQLRAEKRKKYRFRVVNVGSLTGFTLSMQGTQISAIQVDGGGRLQANEGSESIGILYPGERVDMIVEWDQNPPDQPPQLVVILDQEDFLIPNIALTPFQSFPISLTSPKTSRRSPIPYRKLNPPPHYFDLSTASGQTNSSDLFPASADQVINVFANVITSTLDLNKPKGRLNDTSWKVQESPPLPLLALDRAQWDKNQLVPWTGKDPKWVDIVVNNIDFTGHPFHLHGFDFFVLAQCYSVYGPPYNPFSSKPPRCGPYNLVNPPRKDTVYIPAKGYVVLRFRAENEGIWVFHCHILWHHAGGMLMAFQVMGSEEGVFIGEGKRREAVGRFCDGNVK